MEAGLANPLWEFAAVWLMITVPLGATAVACIDATVAVGWRRAMMVPFGIAMASIAHALPVAVGAASLTILSPGILDIVSLCGAAYMVFCGLRCLTRKPITVQHSQPNPKGSLFLVG